MGDFTNVLTTIAACSASIVAILGGLIASRLISLNTERNEVSTRLSEVSEEIAFNEKQRIEAQTALDEDDALDFIRDNIVSLIKGQTLDSIYEKANHQKMKKCDLAPYWETALKILHLIYSDIHEHSSDDEYPENEDNIPLSVAQQLNGDFEYDVCKEIEDYYQRRKSASQLPFAIPPITTPTIKGFWYTKAKNQVAENQARIEWLTIQKKQLEARCDAIRKPKGMKSGMALFAIFSALNIAVPLGLLSFLPPCFTFATWMKFCIISAFVVGMALMLLYLAYLLKWKGPN